MPLPPGTVGSRNGFPPVIAENGARRDLVLAPHVLFFTNRSSRANFALDRKAKVKAKVKVKAVRDDLPVEVLKDQVKAAEIALLPEPCENPLANFGSEEIAEILTIARSGGILRTV